MPAELPSAGALAPGLCLFSLLWAGSLAAVYWDLRQRRGLPRAEQIAWLGLATVLPGLGLLAYLLFKALGVAFPLPEAYAAPGVSKKRVTLLRPAPEAAPRTGTIVAADLVRDTVAERPAMPTPGIRLAVTAGPHGGQDLAAASLPVRLGRGLEAALRLDRDQGVSREHAEIYWQAGQIHIRDLGSTHGTLVNGRRVTEAPLSAGDKIEVGLSTLVVQDAA